MTAVGGGAARVRVVADPEELAETAARAALADLEAAVDAHETCTWVLAGGTTPMATYRRLAAHDLRSAVEWGRVRVAMGDERCVPAGDPESNWGQAAAALLDHVPLGDDQRLPIRGELGAEAAAAAYEAALRRLPRAPHGGGGELSAIGREEPPPTRRGEPPAAPRLEVVWLGVGPDGHCLSLFPGRPEVEVRDRLVVPVHKAPKPPPDRVSLTLAALTGVERLVVLAAGAGKAEAVARARAGERDLPVTRAVMTVEAAGGTVTWLLDRAAAGG
ncbi:MAG TPA: 6-phosphogluconolactonase [Actinomycetes bacterium]|jgi:6-phosphogluconolactonase|nr:6-phosphogluconolactonase [Actinomycetes bacterium]